MNGFKSPKTNQGEICCVDEKDNSEWILIDIEFSSLILKKGLNFRLKHRNLGGHLHSHKDKYFIYPNNQTQNNEVTRYEKKDDNDLWFIHKIV